jgi:predicted transposase/invertase (TIGR01784 family)
VTAFARLRGYTEITKEVLSEMALRYDIEKDAFYREGLEKGREEGREQGTEKEKRATVEACLLDGLSLEATARITRLPLETVRSIASELGY